VSVCVQALPSLHDVPFALLGFEHTPVLVLHVPTSWHWSCAVQTTPVHSGTPAQVPLVQTSFLVNALLSSQAVPFALSGVEHPLSALHVPTS
jgi:hypothetical protein